MDIEAQHEQPELKCVNKGSTNGAVMKAFSSHQCELTSILAQYQMWVDFVVVGLALFGGYFSGFSSFSSSAKTNTPNSNSTRT